MLNDGVAGQTLMMKLPDPRSCGVAFVSVMVFVLVRSHLASPCLSFCPSVIGLSLTSASGVWSDDKDGVDEVFTCSSSVEVVGERDLGGLTTSSRGSDVGEGTSVAVIEEGTYTDDPLGADAVRRGGDIGAALLSRVAPGVLAVAS